MKIDSRELEACVVVVEFAIAALILLLASKGLTESRHMEHAARVRRSKRSAACKFSFEGRARL
jgi:hypothetical protein